MLIPKLRKCSLLKKAIFTVVCFLFALVSFAQNNVAFSPSMLKNADLSSPTSIQFGPDEKLYVAQQNGQIKILTIKRNGPNDYTVLGSEVINLINQTPNHNDDGTLAPGVSERQVTSLLVKGTAAQPLLYVTSSDSRVGGPGGDSNLDTNSGVLSLFTKVNGVWQKVDLVRGLPRSEENHANNGIQIDDQTNIMYMAMGGFTNAGSPSFNFAYITEYALAAAILSIDLNVINALPVKGTGNNSYKYDLPTLDDPTRANNPDGSDINDPFGGNNGLNQSKIVPGGPIQVYASGFRNAYDLLITTTPGKARRMYSIDNGGNQGWGGYPDNEGGGNVTNKYVAGEPGSTGPGTNDPTINNLDNLHYIGNIATYKPGTHYAGHPNPIRANPAGAGLYTFNGATGTGVYRNSKTGPNPLPADWPPVPLSMANPIEGDFQNPGERDSAILTFSSSVNGMAEYTASNFNNSLKGAILAASYDGKIFRITPTENGSNVTNAKSPTNRLNKELAIASGFGAEPLDITVQGDNEIYPGTFWVASYGSQRITIFEPQDFINCTGLYNAMDDDEDGYTNADEIDNGSQPCSGASKPNDSDKDNISDMNDPDDDNDGINDNVDYFPLDPNNGLTTNMPIIYNLFNNDPGTGLFGTGLTGLMSNKKPTNDYLKTFDEENMIAGGAVGAISLIGVTAGDALGALNNQEYAFQFGMKKEAGTGPFTINSRMPGRFFNDSIPKGSQSQGIFIGTGDQSNYLKVAINANGGVGGIEVVYENADIPVSYQFPIAGGIPTVTLDLFLAVNPVTGIVQPKYSANSGPVLNLGLPIQISGPLLNTIQSASSALAVGVISTSRGANPFTATWDWIYVTTDTLTSTGSWQTIAPAAGVPLAREENAYVKAGDKFYLVGGKNIDSVQAYDPLSKTWVNKSKPPLELNHFQGVTLDGLIYVAGAFTGVYPRETPVPQVYVYNPLTDKWINGSTIPVARRRGAAGAVTYKNKIYLVGGITDGHWTGAVNWFDEYDPATNTWKILPNAPRVRDHFQAAVINNKLYVASGRRTSGLTGEFYNLTIPQVDVYDFATGTWSTLPTAANLTTPRAGAATAVLGNELLIVGGETTLAAPNAATEALNVQTNVWRTLSSMQRGRHGTQAIESNNGIYMVAGGGNQGNGSPINSQEAFYLFAPTVPDGAPLAQSPLSAPPGVNFGSVTLNTDSSKTITLNNTGGNQAILVTSVTLTGASSFTDSLSVTVPFVIPVGKSINIKLRFSPTTPNLQTASLIVNHSGQGGSLVISLNGDGSAPVYRINTGGVQVTNSIGVFAADAFYTTAAVDAFSVSEPIAGTTDPAIYQSERYGVNGILNYAFPVTNGQYMVILHFAEIYHSSATYRVFDVSMEGRKVLDNYDIYKKTGSFTATTEKIPVNVLDGSLNIDFTSLEGGSDKPKISAIEILRISTNQGPVANAGADKTITSPASSTTLDGGGTDADGNIGAYRWSQVSGPNTAIMSSNTAASPTLSGLVIGRYVFDLVVTDNQTSPSVADQVTVTVNPAGSVPVYRINAGGGQVTNSIGDFAADAFFTPSGTDTYSASTEIVGTTEDEIYQSERNGINGTLNYDFPVTNGKYIVVLHFAEIYYSVTSTRIFDVSIEGNKVLDNYDIYNKTLANTAIVETFPVTVSDGVLNIYLSALASDGGANRPKIAAIEILRNTSNLVPIANAGPDKTITLPASATILNGSGSDADGTVGTYAWTQVSGPNTATFSSKNVAVPTVSGLVIGSYVFSLVVTDNDLSLSAADQVMVTVNAGSVNQAPVANAGADKSITLPVSSTTLSGSATDADGTVSTYMWTQVSGPNTAIFTSNTATVPTISGLVAGSYVFSLVATDNQLAPSVADQVLVTVNPVPVNQAPIANAGPDISITLPMSATSLSGAGSDVDGTVATYTWTQVSGPNTATFSSKTVAAPSVSGLAAGTYMFSLVVTDNQLLASTADQVVITVNPVAVNQPPVANAGADKSLTLPVTSTILNGSGTDGDGTVTVYTWTQVSGPNTATFASKTVAVPTISGLTAGVYTFSLTVTDNQLATSVADQVVITVNAATGNQPPVANAGIDKLITLPVSSTTLNGSGTDGDGTVTAYAWSQISGPNSATFSSTTVESPSTTGLIAGIYVFSLTVTDNQLAVSVSDQVMITVNAASGNQSPVANAGPDKAVTLPVSTTTLNGSGTDDGTISGYTWAQVSGPNTATFNSNTIAAPTLGGLMAGTYVFSLVVTDNQLANSAADQVVVTVSATNQLPTANAGADKSISLPINTTTLSGSGTDPDGTIIGYAWTQVSGPNTAIFSNITAAVPTVSGLIAGSYVFSLVVSDNQTGVSVADQVVVLVSATNQPPIGNAGPDKSITLPINSTTLNGSGTDADGTIASYAWTQVSGPNTATFSSITAAAPTVSGLIAGSYVFSLVVTDNQTAASLADQVIVNVATVPVATPVFRINAGGAQETNSIGVFAADNYFSPLPGSTSSTATAIAGTTDDAIYQTERFSATGELNYAFPVSNGQYSVVLHFAEIYYSNPNIRIFDVLLEGNRVLDNFDIFKKVGSNTATTETFSVNVTDGALNIYFSSLPADGGSNNPKVSAIEVIRTSTNAAPVANAGVDKSITLPVSSATLNGGGTDADGTVTGYTWSQVSGPNPAIFSSTTVAVPTVSGLIAGNYIFSLSVTDNQSSVSAADQVLLTVNPLGNTPVFRINAGGAQVANSIGLFAADAYFSPAPGNVSSTSSAIAGTTDDAMYQTERYSTTGTLNYAFPVTNGQYSVVLHFAEIFYTGPNIRIFDVSLEALKVLDNFDIIKKVGPNTATTETFSVNVTDGTLNIYFSSLASDGGSNNPKVSAIEIIRTSSNVAPVADAGVDKTITLPVSTTTLNGGGTDADGTVNSYAWAQVSGPNTATFNSKTVTEPSVSGLVAGAYVFSLVVADNQGATSSADEVIVTVNPAGNTPVYRINAGGQQLTNSIGVFAADAYFAPLPGSINSTSTAIAGTTDDAIYQSERFSTTGTFNYAFPVTNGQYAVVLHFAEIHFTGINNRVFDVLLEGTRVLDNFDIVNKVGAFTATTETFAVNVTDGILNVNFSSLAADGGVNNPKVSAIEIIRTSTAQASATEAGSRMTNGTAIASREGLHIPKLMVKIKPNPTITFCTLQITSGNIAPVFMKVYNSEGRLVELKNNILPNAAIQVGGKYIPGLYYAEIIQGKERVALKFIKLKN